MKLQMLRHSLLTAVTVGALGLVVAAGPAEAAPQDVPTGEVAVAVTVQTPPDVNVRPACLEMHLPCTSPRTFGDIGWSVGGARNFTDSVGIAGEVGQYQNVWTSNATLHSNHQENNAVLFAMIGPRFGTSFFRYGRGPAGNDIRLFGQVLIGAQSSSVSPNWRAIQPGVGIDTMTRREVVVRFEFDYCYVPGPGRSLSGPRVELALVIGTGAR